MIPSTLYKELKDASYSGKNFTITSGECRAILDAIGISNSTSFIASDFPSDYVIALTPDKTTLFARPRREGE